MTTFPHVSNDSTKSVHHIQVPSRLVTGKHPREVPLRSGDNALEAVANCSSRSVTPKSRKRPKPEPTPNYNSCTKFRNDSKSSQDLAQPAQCASLTLDEGESSQGNGNCGTSEDEGEAADFYNRRELSCVYESNKHKGKATIAGAIGVEKEVKVAAKVSAKLEMKNAFDFAFLESLMASQGYSILRKKTDGLVLKCPEGHNVHIKYKDKLRVLDCKKCQKRLLKCIQFAQLNKGKVKNEKFDSVVTFECERGHEWECRYGKTTFGRWCPHCEKLAQEERKKALEEEAENARQQAIREQNAILEEARQRMQEDQAKPINCHALFYQWDLPLGNKGLTDASVNQLSKELAVKYLRENVYSPLVNFEDIFLVYKILITAKEVLISKLKAVPAQELCSFYRRYAAKLHPDKNKHPRATEAFQRLAECYKQCCA
eukprot:TRINITY_DN0_c274_g1_i12.p1 TRINITY_DN0_c274_g1~~TRINITY_DN0_c274_g1_i12.p1  ORF type:complete len:429 (+),score=75.12 TRINITY_DN0_c274_g1_i12:83-1369(+)